MTDYASEEWLSIRLLEDEQEAELVEGYLESEGIPCRLESRYSHEFPTHMGRLGEVEILVPAGRAEEARRVLAAREAAFERGSDAGGRASGS
ncbi:MAG: putative signal transducing protein [Thermoanaerobaculia bacterium]